MSQQLLLATRKGLFTAHCRRGRWRLSAPEFCGVPVSMAMVDPRDGCHYAALDHGHFGVKLHRKSGNRWRECAVPSYPQLPKGKVEKDGFGRPVPRQLKLIWSLEIDPRQPKALWCGTVPGGLFHSADAGAHWQLVDSLWQVKARRKWFGGGYDAPGIHSILVDPRHADHLTVGISCGGVWRSTDGGQRWRNIAAGMRADYLPPGQAHELDQQDPHRLAQCLAFPDRVWCQHHNGIFRADKPDQPWREIRAKAVSRFGFACAAHPRDPLTAWFVPADKAECRVPKDGQLLVLRTSDGGKSLVELRAGLPQRDAWDIVYRHGLEVSANGELLALATTSGRAWIGTNGGERWLPLATGLPPVFAVRWFEA